MLVPLLCIYVYLIIIPVDVELMNIKTRVNLVELVELVQCGVNNIQSMWSEKC